MKKILTMLLLNLAVIPAIAQYDSAFIENNWPVIASDTNLTYRQIVTICDSMFAMVGFTDTTDEDTTEAFEHDGSPYVMYRNWRNFWAVRCDVETGKLHDFMADAVAMLNEQQKTTTTPHHNLKFTPHFAFFKYFSYNFMSQTSFL